MSSWLFFDTLQCSIPLCGSHKLLLLSRDVSIPMRNLLIMFTPRADIIPLGSMEASSCAKLHHISLAPSHCLRLCNFCQNDCFQSIVPIDNDLNMPISKRNSRYPYPPRRDRNLQPDAETLSVTGDLALALDV